MFRAVLSLPRTVWLIGLINLLNDSASDMIYLKVGHPAEQIVIYAEGHGIDHIVVGHRGHSLFQRWLIGSVARRVIAYAPCAVTVVRPRA